MDGAQLPGKLPCLGGAHMLKLVALKKTPSVAEGHRPPNPRLAFLWRLIGMTGKEERFSPL